MNIQDVGVFIRTERKRQNLTIQRLAEQAGVDRTLLSKLENQRLPEMGFAKLERILSVLGSELMLMSSGGLPTLNDLKKVEFVQADLKQTSGN